MAGQGLVQVAQRTQSCIFGARFQLPPESTLGEIDAEPRTPSAADPGNGCRLTACLQRPDAGRHLRRIERTDISGGRVTFFGEGSATG